MAKNKISEYSATASNNTDIGGINISEGCAPSGINNAIRELMAQLKDQQAGTDADGFVVGGAFTSSGGAVFSSGTTFSGSVVMSSTVGISGVASLTGSTNNIGTTTSATILSGSVTQTSGSVLYLDAAATTSAAPPLSWSGDTNTGIYRPAADTLSLVTNGIDRLRVNSAGIIIIGTGEGTTSVTGNILRSPSGTGTNISGSNLEIQAGNGTGTQGSGSIVFKTAPVGSTGSTANTLTQRLAITKTGAFSFGTTATDYGTANQVLTSNGDALPTWKTLVTATGTAPIYGVRAWASFNGTTAAINASGNIASIVRNSTGNYTITFTTAMTSNDYAVSLCGFNTGATSELVGHVTSASAGSLIVQFNQGDGTVTDAGGNASITIVM